jgi:soluble lytic murein transglycosylase-like protein
MKPRLKPRTALAALAVLASACPLHAAEHITLRNGFELDCIRREATGDHVRLYLIPTAASAQPASANYIEVLATSVLRVETIPDPAPSAAPTPAQLLSSPSLLSFRSAAKGSASPDVTPALTPAEIHQLLARAGTLHNIDTDLLASVVQAESGGNTLAVSRAGAQGLMQLMPATASLLNVRDSFAPEQNIGGGTAYLDALLTRYNDNIALALAAYNAGPAAVDRYHGIPPYAETRAYVARVIREFNRRKRAAALAQLAAK